MEPDSSFALVECISLNHKMLFHYQWFLSTCLAFLTAYTNKPRNSAFVIFILQLYLIYLENKQMQQVHKKMIEPQLDFSPKGLVRCLNIFCSTTNKNYCANPSGMQHLLLTWQV